MTIEEKRRELFEIAVAAANPDDYAKYGRAMFEWNGATYAWTWVNWDWLLWNSALDAVEIELPVSEVEGCHGVELVCFPDDIRSAIESTGLGLKVKP